MVLTGNRINMYLHWDDSQLKFIINMLAVNAGIDLGYFGLKQQDSRLASALADWRRGIAEHRRQIDAKGKKGHA